jgi:hypothetical protein
VIYLYRHPHHHSSLDITTHSYTRECLSRTNSYAHRNGDPTQSTLRSPYS